MTRQTREMLNDLSKQIFGSTSKWQKLVNDGFPELYTREREVMVPKANGAPTKKIFTDRKFVTRRYTEDEVLKLMLDILQQRNAAEADAADAQVPTETAATE